jgi:choline dehydrogenase
LAHPFITGVAYRSPGNSAAVAYLPPSVLKRPNLTVAVKTVVERVLFDESGSEPRAVGVEVSKSPEAPKYRIKANREVIICGGTIASPHILLVSGIGPKEVLSKAGIKVVKDLPQVGKNYYDVSFPKVMHVSMISPPCIAHFVRSHLFARQAWLHS